MKILLVNKFHYQKGGSERVYFDTKEILEKNGHEVICFSMKDERNRACAQDYFFVPNVDFQSRKNWFLKAMRFIYFSKAAENLEKLIVQEKPDVAHLHNISHQLTPAILKPLKEHKVPVVQTLHDYQLICPNYRLFTKGKVCERCRKHKYYNCVFNKCVQNSFAASLLSALELKFQWLFRFYKQKVDLFISPSEFLKERVQDWGIKKQIKVVNNFIDVDKFKPNYELGDYVVCVSRLSREKGIFTLLKAIRKLPEIKLKLIGTGPQKEKVEDYIKKKQIKNVEYLGAKYDPEHFEIIKNSRFFIMPSEWHENYPLLVLEAMALGKPVLAAKLGGLTEMITENHNGWFFQPGKIKDLREKIKQHYSEIENIEKMGKNARATVEQNNCSKEHYEKLMRCYRSVVKDDSGAELG
ncbi:glycosyltransferase family 4 protein [Candidatus Kuenenbacteria bacterium]|nr:glycosyltransferase family 4 protein [Candidatus Kuenenbacteria bacterium]